MGLPAAAAADVSLAGAGSSRTHLPGPRHCSSARTLRLGRGGCKLAGTHGARGAGGLGGGDACGRRQLALARLSQREPRLEEPGASTRLSPAAAASLFYPSELQSASGTGPQKSRKSCLPPGERSPSSLCLESQHLQMNSCNEFLVN